MNPFLSELEKRNLGTFREFSVNEIDLCLITLENGSRILTTTALHTYSMPVLPKWIGREHNEIFFHLPNYWECDESCPNLKWTSEWLAKLAKFVADKKSWFGPGHTIDAGNPPTALSPTMKQKYLMFIDPIILEHKLKPIIFGDKTIQMLALIPIFGDELDYKMGKDTNKFLKRYIKQNFSELLDDYRVSFLTSRWKMF